MSTAELTFPVKTLRPDIGFYVLMTCLTIISAFTVFSGRMNAEWNKTANLFMLFIFVLSHFAVLVGLSFESFRRYSRFGISHTRHFLNHTLSIAMVVFPFLSIVLPFMILPSLGLMALSKYRSPDDPREKALAFYCRDGIFELADAILWALAAFILFF